MSLAALGITAAGALGQYALNQRSQKKAFQQNVDFWKQKFDETNKYNSPVQQVARLKEAGLNPAMMYGQSASGATGQATSQSSEGRKAAQAGGMENLGLVSLQAEQIKQQIELGKQDAALRRVQATTEMAKGAKTNAEAKTASELSKTSAELFNAELRSAQQKATQDAMGTEIMSKTKQDQINGIVSDARYKLANAKNKEYENEIYEETRQKLVKMGLDPKLIMPMINLFKK